MRLFGELMVPAARKSLVQDRTRSLYASAEDILFIKQASSQLVVTCDSLVGMGFGAVAGLSIAGGGASFAGKVELLRWQSAACCRLETGTVVNVGWCVVQYRDGVIEHGQGSGRAAAVMVTRTGQSRLDSAASLTKHAWRATTWSTVRHSDKHALDAPSYKMHLKSKAIAQ